MANPYRRLFGLSSHLHRVEGATSKQPEQPGGAALPHPEALAIRCASSRDMRPARTWSQRDGRSIAIHERGQPNTSHIRSQVSMPA